jgi:hypothetical protein
MNLTSKKKAPKKAKKKQQPPPAKNSPYVKPQIHLVWHTRYQELVNFHNVHKHIRVPSSYNTGLYNWVRYQKERYKDYKLGKKCTLTEEEVGLLRDLCEKYWFGGINNTKKASHSRNNKKMDEDDIGSVDSYSVKPLFDDSDDEPYFTGGKTALQKEVKNLASPKWMDVSLEKEEGKKKRGGGSAKKSRGREILDGYGDVGDDESGARGSSSKSKSAKRRGKESKRYDDESDFDRNGRSRSNSKSAKRRNSRRSVDESEEDSDYVDDDIERSGRRGSYTDNKHAKRRERSRSFSDDSVEHDNKHRSDTKRKGRRWVKEYSDDDLSSVELEPKRTHAKKHKKPLTPPKTKRTAMKSSLEMIEAPKELLVPRKPSKRKGVVSEESQRPTKQSRKEPTSNKYSRSSSEESRRPTERSWKESTSNKYYRSSSEESRRPTKRSRKESTSNKYSCDGYDSEASASCSESSYSSSESRYTTASSSSTSISAASTRSSSLYGPTNPMNEVVFTKQTKTFSTHNQRNREFRAMMAERRELMMEYEYLYARNLERIRAMPQKLAELKSMHTMLIENGCISENDLEGPDQLMLKAQEETLIFEESIASPAQLRLRAQRVGLVEDSSYLRLTPRVQNAGLIEGGTYRDGPKECYLGLVSDNVPASANGKCC